MEKYEGGVTIKEMTFRLKARDEIVAAIIIRFRRLFDRHYALVAV